MDFKSNSATNTGADREEDKLVDALKTRLGPLPLLCLVTVLNLINGFSPQNGWKKKTPEISSGKLTHQAVKQMPVSFGCVKLSPYTNCTDRWMRGQSGNKKTFSS